MMNLERIIYTVLGLAIMLVGLVEQFFTNEKFEGFVVWCFGFVICEIALLTKEDDRNTRRKCVY